MKSAIARVVLAGLALTASALVGPASPASAFSSGWTSVSSGGNHTCGIRGGRIYCWGNDEFGQLGDGTAGGVRATPAPIASGATDWTSVSAGAYHTCAIRVGRVACWGQDVYGQLGDGTAGDAPDSTPGFIASGATDWKSVSAGTDHTCAIRVGPHRLLGQRRLRATRRRHRRCRRPNTGIHRLRRHRLEVRQRRPEPYVRDPGRPGRLLGRRQLRRTRRRHSGQRRRPDTGIHRLRRHRLDLRQRRRVSHLRDPGRPGCLLGL